MKKMKYILVLMYFILIPFKIYAENNINESIINNKNSSSIKINSALQTSLEAGDKIKKDINIKYPGINKIISSQILFNEINKINSDLYLFKNENEIENKIILKNNIFNNFINNIKNDKLITNKEDDSEYKINNLLLKININKNNNNKYSVERDLIKIEEVKIENDFYKISKEISNMLKKYQKSEEINNKIKNYNDLADKYEKKLKLFSIYVEKNKYNFSEKQLIEENQIYIDFTIKLNTYKDIIFFLESNKNTIFNNNIVNEYDINKFLNKINENKYVFPINKYLYNLNIDMGRIILFISSFLLFYVLRNRTSWILNLLNKLNNNLKNHDKFYMYSNNIMTILLKLKNEIEYLIVVLGFSISMSILMYPEINKTINNIVYIMYMVIYLLVVLKIFDHIIELKIEKLEKSKLKKSLIESIHIGIKIGNISIILFFIIHILNHFGLNFFMGIISVISFIGLALSFGAKDFVSNLFGGIKLLLDGNITQGDIIEYEDVKGHVIERGLLTTQIRTFYNEMVTIPNSNLIIKSVRNKSRKKIGSLIRINYNLDFENEFNNIEKAKLEIEEYLKNNSELSIENINLKKGKINLLSSNDYYGVKKTMFVKIDEVTEFSLKLKIICYSKSVDYEEWVSVKDKIIMESLKILKNNDIKIKIKD